jgi:hypothetical protein
LKTTSPRVIRRVLVVERTGKRVLGWTGAGSETTERGITGGRGRGRRSLLHLASYIEHNKPGCVAWGVWQTSGVADGGQILGRMGGGQHKGTGGKNWAAN